jgi:hypothetical protein
LQLSIKEVHKVSAPEAKIHHFKGNGVNDLEPVIGAFFKGCERFAILGDGEGFCILGLDQNEGPPTHSTPLFGDRWARIRYGWSLFEVSQADFAKQLARVVQRYLRHMNEPGASLDFVGRGETASSYPRGFMIITHAWV